MLKGEVEKGTVRWLFSVSKKGKSKKLLVEILVRRRIKEVYRLKIGS